MKSKYGKWSLHSHLLSSGFAIHTFIQCIYVQHFLCCAHHSNTVSVMCPAQGPFVMCNGGDWD